ncbi:hypothetical protein OH76DRAFT_313688 [Lentinus brumalis]|uniref:Uncharacterized protein n=1 Tax=Lentinus brumalis TaxID=2498619 RepID=A0A371CK29_9APHY|nr:hypothetical protein OH76DRAFT_313688 [Polyporus brumalis]
MQLRRTVWASEPTHRILHDDLNMNEAKNDRIRLKHPGMAAWSLDHHVLTVGLDRGGVVHKRFAHVMDHFYALLCPEERPTTHAPYHRALPVVSMVVPAMINSTFINERAAAVGLWQEVLSWVLDSRKQKPEYTKLIDVQHRVSTNHMRCVAYDDVRMRKRSSELPHEGIEPLLMEHWLLQHDACQNVTMHAEASGGGYITAKYAPKIKELEEAQDHAQRMHLTVDKYFTPLPSRKAAALRKTAQAESRRLKSRLRKYPIASTVDEAWEVVDDLLLPELSEVVGTAQARDFLQDISFFQPVHTTDTAPADGGFRLPVLLIWHQHPNYDLDPVTKNVQRLCCASAARFLAVLGISDFPVYGLITAGQSAYPCVAWHSSADEFLYIADRNTAEYRFDLSAKEGVRRFAGFLDGLQDHAAQLKVRFVDVRPQLVERMCTDAGRESLRWTFRTQLDKYKLWPQAADVPA